MKVTTTFPMKDLHPNPSGSDLVASWPTSTNNRRTLITSLTIVAGLTYERLPGQTHC